MTITKQQFDAAVEAERPKWGQFAGLWEEAIASIRDRLFPEQGYTYDPVKPDRITVDGREYEITQFCGKNTPQIWLNSAHAVSTNRGKSPPQVINWPASGDFPKVEDDLPATEIIPPDVIPAVVALIRQHAEGGK